MRATLAIVILTLAPACSLRLAADSPRPGDGDAGNGRRDANGDGSGGGDCGSDAVPSDEIALSSGIAIAEDGTLYYTTSDGVGRRLPGESPDPGYVVLAGSPNPRNLAIRDDGILFVTDTGNATVHQIDTGQGDPMVSPWLSNADGIEGLTIDPDGTLYLSNPSSGDILRSATPESASSALAETLPGANAMVFDTSDTLIVATRTPAQIWELDMAGGVETGRKMDVDESPDARFEGIGFDDTDHIYVTDESSGSLLRYFFDDNDIPEELLSGQASPAGLAFSHAQLRCGVYVANESGALGFYAEDLVGIP